MCYFKDKRCVWRTHHGVFTLVFTVYEYDFLETFRFDTEYEFNYTYDFLETFRFDTEYESDYTYDFLETFRFDYE